MNSKTLARKIAQAALSKKAYEVVLMDLRKLTTMADYFVVCSIDSDTQARAVADEIKHQLMEKGEIPARREGYTEGRWILLDYVDVVAHIFHKDVRAFYNIEKLWGDAVFESVKDEPQSIGGKEISTKKVTAKASVRTVLHKKKIAPKKKTTRKKTTKK